MLRAPEKRIAPFCTFRNSARAAGICNCTATRRKTSVSAGLKTMFRYAKDPACGTCVQKNADSLSRSFKFSNVDNNLSTSIVTKISAYQNASRTQGGDDALLRWTGLGETTPAIVVPAPTVGNGLQ